VRRLDNALFCVLAQSIERTPPVGASSMDLVLPNSSSVDEHASAVCQSRVGRGIR
jgi:hypothetical protein